jgi:hypothetical protein
MLNTSRSTNHKTSRPSLLMHHFMNDDLRGQPWTHFQPSKLALTFGPAMPAQALESRAPATRMSKSEGATNGSVKSQTAEASEDQSNTQQKHPKPCDTILALDGTCSQRKATTAQRGAGGKVQEIGERDLMKIKTSVLAARIQLSGIQQHEVSDKDMIQDLMGVGTMFGK